MVSTNKILTVSYGTFSCTLEGFDNSFDTMKAIAEYFRDLAQDDRYFGAEPPTPDAEMLARIAEREIARRVEARFEKGNLVLRPSEEAAPPQGDVAPAPPLDAATLAATAGAAATALAVADNDPSEDEVDVSAFLVEEDTGNADVYVDTAESGAPEIAEDDTEAEIDFDALADDTEDDDTTLDLDLDLADALDEAEPSIDDVIAAAEDADDVAEDSEDLLADAGEETEDTAFDMAEEVAPIPEVADSVADKLQRIRAVVAARPDASREFIEDEHAMAGPGGDGVDENDEINVSARLAAGADEVDEPVDAVAESEAVDDNLFTDTIAAIVNDEIDTEDDDDEDAFLPDDDDVEDEDEDEDHAGVDDAVSDAEAELAELRAKIAELEGKTASRAAPELPAAETSGVEDAASETAAPIVARVSKAKRSDVEAALASGEIEEYEDDAADDATGSAVATKTLPGSEDSSLTPEQEAELARELAELQAEIEDDDDWSDDDAVENTLSDEDRARIEEVAEDSEASIRKAVKLTSPARAMLTDTKIEEDGKSVERLIDQTETEMTEPEGNRRRSAIAHLRAAVAATKADRLLGLGKRTAKEEKPYREDLADAVRPRRPQVSETRSERPVSVRPAPLKLVAEQRVDATKDEEAAPVRPRRITRSADVAPVEDDVDMADDTGFAEFAESQGAHSLPELLEAAAAYMSFVEGRDQFSRPQLMTKLRQAEGDTSSREERLRSFGQLLRDGKIEKKGGGRFAASDNIGFKPKARAAG